MNSQREIKVDILKIGCTESGTLEAEGDNQSLVLYLKSGFNGQKNNISYTSRPFYFLEALQEALERDFARVSWIQEGEWQIGAGYVPINDWVEVVFKSKTEHPGFYFVIQDRKREWQELVRELKRLPMKLEP